MSNTVPLSPEEAKEYKGMMILKYLTSARAAKYNVVKTQNGVMHDYGNGSDTEIGKLLWENYGKSWWLYSEIPND